MSIRYLDSGREGPQACLGQWLDHEMQTGIREFRGQFGFFDFSALRRYRPVLEAMIAGGGTFKLVIGANCGDPASLDDMDALMDLIDGSRSATLTIVALSNALFHPKTLHLVRSDGTVAAVVGSANLTAKGLGHNVEAAVVIEGSEQTDSLLRQISLAIDYWSSCSDPGVYQVARPENVRELRNLGLVVTPETRRRLRGANRAQALATGRGARQRGWFPPAVPEVERDLPEVEETGEGRTPDVDALTIVKNAIAERWCKRLRSSDAQQVREGTNPTGKLRLSRARFEIDQTTYFREFFFAEENWVQVDRRSMTYEEAHIQFEVALHGGAARRMTLRVDHAPHRVADQNNVPTVLGWGPQLGQWLRQNDQQGNWIILEKDQNGNYWMSFDGNKPDWAP